MPTLAKNTRSTPAPITVLVASAGPFSLGFRLFDDDTIEVYVNGLKRTDWTLSSSYSSGYDDTATITFTSNLAVNDEIVIYAALVPNRAEDLSIGDQELVAKLNIELVRAWSAIADLRHAMNRTLRVTDVEQDWVKPQVGSALGFNPDGTFGFTDVLSNDVTVSVGVENQIVGFDDAGNLTGLSTVVGPYTFSGAITISGEALFPDGVLSKFGTDSDLQISHSGTHGTIHNATGNLYLRGDSVQLLNGAGTEIMLSATADGAVSLRYDDAVKLVTSPSGVTITGTLTADELGGALISTDQDFTVDGTKLARRQDIKALVDAASGFDPTALPNFAVGDTVRYSDASPPSNILTNSSPLNVFSASFLQAGTLRIDLEHRVEPGSGSDTSTFRVVVNGVVVQSWAAASASGWVTRTLDLTLVKGDTLEMDHYTTFANRASNVRNLTLSTSSGTYLFPYPAHWVA